MKQIKTNEFLVADRDEVFEIARQLSAGAPYAGDFLNDLKLRLADFDQAHLVCALMIGRDLDPDGFAVAAAPFLASGDGAVWTAAQRLLLEVSRLSHNDYNIIASYADQYLNSCDDLKQCLKTKIYY